MVKIRIPEPLFTWLNIFSMTVHVKGKDISNKIINIRENKEPILLSSLLKKNDLIHTQFGNKSMYILKVLSCWK